jgi:hypothetical protein
MAKPKPLPPPPRLDRAAISESVARRKIEGIVGAVAAGKPGSRNAVAYWGARRLAELVALRILGQADAIALSIAAAGQAGLPPKEAAAIAASAFGRGQA